MSNVNYQSPNTISIRRAATAVQFDSAAPANSQAELAKHLRTAREFLQRLIDANFGSSFRRWQIRVAIGALDLAIVVIEHYTPQDIQS